MDDNVMTEERFAEIMREYGYKGNIIRDLWNTRRTDHLDEKRLRKTAEEKKSEFLFNTGE